MENVNQKSLIVFLPLSHSKECQETIFCELERLMNNSRWKIRCMVKYSQASSVLPEDSTPGARLSQIPRQCLCWNALLNVKFQRWQKVSVQMARTDVGLSQMWGKELGARFEPSAPTIYVKQLWMISFPKSSRAKYGLMQRSQYLWELTKKIKNPIELHWDVQRFKPSSSSKLKARVLHLSSKICVKEH